MIAEPKSKPRSDKQFTILRCASGTVTSTSAVMLGTLPNQCASRRWQRTQHHRFPLASFVATVRCHDGIPPRPGDTLPPARGSATSTSAVMPAVLPLRLRCRAGAAVQPDRHHRFLFASDVALVSVNGVVAIAEQPERRFAAGAAHT